MFWHWPDRTIGKRESRQLREEHNALGNLAHELLDVVRPWVEVLDSGAICDIRPGSTAHVNAREAFRKAEKMLNNQPTNWGTHEQETGITETPGRDGA